MFTCMHIARTFAKIILFTLLGLLILLFVAGFFIEPMAKRLLVEQVEKAGKGQYSLQLDSVSISLLQGDIRLSGVRFHTDTSRQGRGPLVFAEARELSAGGVAWLTYLISEKIFLDHLSLKEADIYLQARTTDQPTMQEPFHLQQLDIYPMLKEYAESVALDELSLSNIHFTLVNISRGDTLQLQAPKLNLQGRDILIGPDKLLTDERTFYAAQMELEGKQLKFKKTGSRQWEGETEHLLLESREQSLAAELENALFLGSKEQGDTLLYTALRAFSLKAFELSSLQQQKTLKLEKVSLTGADILNQQALNDTLHSAAASNQPQDAVAEFSLASFLPAFMEEVAINKLALEDIDYRQRGSFSLQGFGLLAEELLLNQEPAFQENRFLHARRIESSFDSLGFSVDTLNHSLKVKDFLLSAKEGEGDLSVSQLAVSPVNVPAQALRIEGSVGAFRLQNINTSRLAEGILQIGRAELPAPQLRVHLPSDTKQSRASAAPFATPDFFPLIEGSLKELQLGELQLSHGSIRLSGLGERQGSLFVPEVNLQLQEVLLAKGTAFAEGRVLHSRDISLSLDQLRFSLPDTLYVLELAHASLSTLQQRFSLHNIVYKVSETHKKALERPAYEQLVRLENKEFRIEGLQYGKLLQGQGLFARKLISRGTDLQVFTAEDSAEAAEEAVPDTTQGKRKLALNKLNLGTRLPAFIKKVAIESLDVQQVDIWKMKEARLLNFQLAAKDVQLHSQAAFADNRFLHAKEFQAGFDSLWVNAGDPRHFIQLKGLNLQVNKGIGELSLQQLKTLPQERLSSQTWLKAAVPAFKIEAINTRELVPEGSLTIGQVAIVEPELLLHLPGESIEEKKKKESAPPDLYPLIEGVLDRLRLAHFKLLQGDIRVAGLGGSAYGLALPELNLQMEDIYIGPETAFAGDRILHSRNIEARLADLTYIFPDRVYSLQVEDISLSTARKSFEWNNFRYMYGGNYRKILEGPEINEVYRFFNRRLQASGIDYQQLFRQGELHMDKVVAEGMDIYVFKDLNLPEADVVKPLPAEMIRSLGMPLAIEKFSYQEIDVTYEEMTQGAEIAGRVTLEELQGEIRNITNIRSAGQLPEMTVNARGKLQGQGAFESEIKVPLFGENKKIQVQGSLDTLDITSLNRILRFNTPISTASGTLYKLRWDFEAGEEESEGEFEVSYENLSVQLSEPDSPDTTGILKDIGSFLANKLIVDSSIAEGKSTEPKEVYFVQQREKKRSFFHYYAISLMAGFIEAIGVPFQ